MLMCIQNLVGFCQFVLKILSGNEILMSIKGRNSVKILQIITGNNPKLDHVNVDVHTKFGRILSMRSQDIERKRNSDVNQGPYPYRNQVQNRHKILYLFCTIYVPFHFRHKIGIPILYQSENLEILHVPFMCLCGLRLFCLYLFCAFQDLVIFSCAYFIPSLDLVIF